jgi:hypothetical protein
MDLYSPEQPGRQLKPLLGLFWFGLASSISYVLMILFLRKSYGKLAETNLAERGSL